MKVLIVCSAVTGRISPFIEDQVNKLKKLGVSVYYFTIKENGVKGYLKARKKLLIKLDEIKPDIIHAHYGLSGLLANLQRRIPVVTTYHGSDINNSFPYQFSRIAIKLSAFNIFVSSKLAIKAGVKKNFIVRSCGVDVDVFNPINRDVARKELGLKQDKKYVLFSSSFNNKVKNYPLAEKSIKLLQERGENIELLEFKGYARKQVNILMNAVDCILVTSLKESGPLVIKEALAVNTCAVSLDVGDVKEVIGDCDGYFITKDTPEAISRAVSKAVYKGRPKCRERIINNYDNLFIAKEIIKVYNKVLKR